MSLFIFIPLAIFSSSSPVIFFCLSLSVPMRSEENPLDLNNFPEDGAVIDESSSEGKVYECRFCSLKFYKSQALGGHMNRHRQERETETLNRARQLVLNNDGLAAQTFHQLDGQPIPHGVLYHQNPSMGDPNQYRPLYSPPSRLFSGSSSTLVPPQPPYRPLLYPSPSRLISYASPYPPPPPHDYFMNHVLPGSSHYIPTSPPTDMRYTYIGAPVRHTFPTTSDGNRVSNMATSANGRGDTFHNQFR